MFVTCICLIILGAISEPLIYCLIGPRWHEAASYLPFICISMSFYPLHAINLNMLQVEGRSDIFLYLEIIKKIIAIIPICFGVFFDIYSMLIATIFVGILSFFLNSWYTGKFIGYTSLEQIKDVMHSYLFASFVALIVYFIKYIPISYWIILPLQLFVGLVLILVLGELFNSYEYKEIKKIIFKNR